MNRSPRSNTATRAIQIWRSEVVPVICMQVVQRLNPDVAALYDKIPKVRYLRCGVIHADI